jgi:hypothetical protein
MATETEKIGRTSELVAQAKLMRAGFTVYEPQTTEHHDILIEKDGIFQRAQIKTVHVRSDRDNALVVFSKKSDGSAYTFDEAQLIIAVLNDKHVFAIENKEQKEYWSKDLTRAKKKWQYLK